MKKIRWGIAGPGIIAHKFAEAINKVKEAELVAVASRSLERAESFASEFGIKNVFSSYEGMAGSTEVDAVYISTAHPFHKPCAEIFLKAKKHVLCEKPMCVNARQAEELKKTAKENGVFLMEAVWTRFLPAVKAVQKTIADGEIGAPMAINADFCYSIEIDEDKKLFENGLAGGSLLDVGVYCLHFADIVFGKEPKNIYAVSNIQNGVDIHTQMLLKYDNNETASLSSAIKLEKPYDAYIYGTRGNIYIPNFYKAERFVVKKADGTAKECQYPYGENGFEFEIREVCHCIAEGRKESNIFPLSETVKILKQMDNVRKQIGLSYPFDNIG